MKTQKNVEGVLKDIKWLEKFCDRKNNIVYCLLKVILTTCEMVVLIYVGDLFSDVIEADNITPILQSLTKIFCLVSASILLTVIANKLLVKVKENPILNLQKKTLKQIFNLGIPFFEKQETGLTFALFHTTIPAIKNVFELHFPQLINNAISLIVALVLFLRYSGTIGLLVILLLIPNMFIHKVFNKIISRMITEHIEKQQIFNKNVFSMISSIREMRAYQCEAWQRQKLEASYRDYKNLKLKTLRKRYMRGMFFRLNTALGVISYLLMAVYYMKTKAMMLDDFITCFFYCTSLVYVFNGLVFNITEMLPALKQVEVLKKIFDEPYYQSKMDSCENIDEMKDITLKNIKFSYDKERSIINNVSLEINKKDKILFTGESGIGKTTLLKLIAGFYQIEQGEIAWNGKSYDNINPEKLREKIGYLFQESYLFGGSILENIRMGRETASDDEVIRAAKTAGIDEFINGLPEKYETQIGERGTLLSGGQRQRLAIARLVLRNPDIVIMDEATSSLDKKTEDIIMNNIVNDIFKDKTIIAISHRKETFPYYERIVLFDKSKIYEIERNEFLTQS